MSKMDQSGLINKIKSLYVLQGIFNYIEDENFKSKLFLHSKSFQKKLDIKFYSLKENYLRQIGFNIKQYLHIDEDKYKRKILSQKYDDFLTKKKI